MKHCPTCKRTFNDDTLRFCLDDGTPLLSEPTGPDLSATLVLPTSDRKGATAQTPIRETIESPVPAPFASAYAPQSRPQRRIWPWLVAALAVGLLVIGGVAGVIVVSSSLMQANKTEPPKNDWPTPKTSPTPVSEDDAPTDSDKVLGQLTRLEDEWERANTEADKSALDRILAEEYQGDGQDKKKYLETIQPHPGRKWSFSNFRLDLNGKRAELKYHLVRTEPNAKPQAGEYTDTFVWRDRRWQAVSSHAIYEN
jgi:hypothetical protein